MKMKSFFIAALATVALVSCAKDEPTTNVDDQAKTNFVVALPGTLNTYAVEDPAAAGQIVPTYSDVIVYLVDGGGNIKGHVWTTAEIAAGSKRFEMIKEPAKVIVVANKGAATLLTDGVLVDLQAQLSTLAIADQNKTGGNSVKEVTLYGEQVKSSFTAGTPNDGHTLQVAAVELKSLVSRFEAGTVKPGTGLVSLTVEAVYVNYFHIDYSMTTSQGYTELDWPSTFTPAWATDAGNSAVTSMPGTKAYSYQVFAGGLIPHIIYKVGGEVKPDFKLSDGTTGTFTGKFITVKGFFTGTAPNQAKLTAIEAHKIYKMGLENGGIVIDAEDITNKPETVEVDLIVNITVADWTTENVTPEI